MRKQFSLLLGERARLSREVHDTLLQSMFGYALQFDTLADAVGSSAPHLRERLAQLRHQVEDDIREARQSIWNLRSPMLERQDLPKTLKDVAEHAVASTPIDLDVDVTGSPRRASPLVEEQLLRIGREAVSNCVRHAKASRIKMSLHYGADAIVLTVADDGRGFDAAKQQDESEHFGLTTMRERAESVGGTLRVRSAEGEGTTVTASVPTA
jgi:signal transduction histidine kinase